MPRDSAEGWTRDPTCKNTAVLVGRGTAHHICKQLPGEHRKASLGGLRSPAPHQTQKGLQGPPPPPCPRMKQAPRPKNTVAAAAGRAPLGCIPSSCIGMAGSCAGSSSSRRPAARTSGLMHLYLGTSLPEIVKLEQVQRVAANAIKSCSELGGEVERAKPARLAKRWGGAGAAHKHPRSTDTREMGKATCMGHRQPKKQRKSSEIHKKTKPRRNAGMVRLSELVQMTHRHKAGPPPRL